MPRIDDPYTYKDACHAGIRWHRPSEQFLAQVGYRDVRTKAPDGTITTKRVRATQYLGRRESHDSLVSKYESLKAVWESTLSSLREAYDEEQGRRRQANLPLLPRFKPVWPDATERAARAERPASTPPPVAIIPAHHVSPALPAFSVQAARDQAENFALTIKEACKKYLATQESRIGLRGGKGINKNTFKMHKQSLILGLGLNEGYTRATRPIETSKKLCDLTKGDYEAFVAFWCNPANIKSERTPKNYINAFSRMEHYAPLI